MATRHNPYNSGIGHNGAKRNLIITEIQERNSRGGDLPQRQVTASPLSGGTFILNIRKIYKYRKPAVEEALKEAGALNARIKTEGNYFHLTATFPDVNSANLAANAIRAIVNGR